MTIGERLKELRKECKLTQIELAEKLNVNYQTVARIEKNQREPSIDILLKMCQIFNVSSDYLLGKTKTKSIQDYTLEKNVKKIEHVKSNAKKYIEEHYTSLDDIEKANLEKAFINEINNYLGLIDIDSKFELDHLPDTLHLINTFVSLISSYAYEIEMNSQPDKTLIDFIEIHEQYRKKITSLLYDVIHIEDMDSNESYYF